MTRRTIPNAVLLAVVAVATLALSAPPADARRKKKQEEEVDHLALAALLVRDGHHERAEIELGQVDLEAEQTDKKLYFRLRGFIALDRKRWADVVEHLSAAIDAGDTDPVLLVFVTQAHHQLGQFEQALEWAEKIPPEQFAKLPKLHLLKADAQIRLGRKFDAYATLLAAETADPTLLDASRRKIQLLIDMGLYRTAAEAGREFLERPGTTVEDHLAVAKALIQSRALEEAAELLEIARLRYPEDPRVMAQLGLAYKERGLPLAAAALFERASIATPERALEAAELYRQGGALQRALYMNARVIDQKAKVRQRMGLLVELGQLESAAALEPRLVRLGLTREDPVIYALAYAYFRTDRFDAAERWLKRLNDPDLFEKAAQLRKIMEACKSGEMRCDS